MMRVNRTYTPTRTGDEDMRDRRRTAGFTMVEALVVVAIVTILGGIVFVNLAQHQRQLRQVELDGTAKEIYVAAQNHLAMAASQGLLENTTQPVTQAAQEEVASGGRSFGFEGTDEDNGAYYVVSPYADGNAENTFDSLTKTTLAFMLPFGSIDEHVRNGDGSYVIRYNPSSGTVLDVFYSDSDLLSTPAANKQMFAAEVTKLLRVKRGAKTDDFHLLQSGDYTTMVGYCGGEDLSKVTTDIEKPTVTVKNGDLLEVTVRNYTLQQDASGNVVENGVTPVHKYTNQDLKLEKTDGSTETIPAQLRLYIKGVTSKQVAYIDLVYKENGTYKYNTYFDTDNASDTHLKAAEGTEFHHIVIDDVTTLGSHFADLKTNADKHIVVEDETKEFIPGENIQIWAEAFTTAGIGKTARSATHRTNSLFASLRIEEASTTEGGQQTPTTYTARIRSFRHLENLSETISSLDTNKIKVVAAEQVSNVDWNDFVDSMSTTNASAQAELHIYGETQFGLTQPDNEATAKSENETFTPVKMPEKLAYDGLNHIISNVRVKASGPAGLFSQITNGSSVKNLVLAGFDVTSKDDDAGVLAGKVSSTGDKVSLTAVLARDGKKYLTPGNNRSLVTTSKVTGAKNAGGLVGDMVNAEVSGCAASVWVSGAGSVGGLVGSADNSMITYSYAAGHTKEGKFEASSSNLSAANVYSSAGNAGGLVGTAQGSTKIDTCYATCSVGGATNAGGLVGSATGGEIAGSYAAGYVGGNTKGAFIGNASSVTLKDNYYYGLANPGEGDKPEQLAAVGSGSSDVTDFSSSQTLFATLAPFTAHAVPNDSQLVLLYDGKYEFLTINGLYQLNTDEPTGVTTDVEALKDATWLEVHRGDWPAAETLVVNKKN